MEIAPNHVASFSEQKQNWEAVSLPKPKSTSQHIGGMLFFKQHFSLRKRKGLLSKISDSKSAAKCHQDCERQVLMEGWKMPPPELWLLLLQTLHVPISLRGLWSPSPLHTYTGTSWSPHLTQALRMSLGIGTGGWVGSGGRQRQLQAQELPDVNPPAATKSPK